MRLVCSKHVDYYSDTYNDGSDTSCDRTARATGPTSTCRRPNGVDEYPSARGHHREAPSVFQAGSSLHGHCSITTVFTNTASEQKRKTQINLQTILSYTLYNYYKTSSGVAYYISNIFTTLPKGHLIHSSSLSCTIDMQHDAVHTGSSIVPATGV